VSINLFPKIILICISGFTLSLSAPGYDLWILAWVCISPLFIAINTSKKLYEVISYSFLFGFSYYFWYYHWLFSLHPLSWLGLTDIESYAVAIVSVLVPTILNSLYFVLYGIIIRLIKNIVGSSSTNNVSYLILVSLLWVIIFNKIAASKLLLGFPWALIEYSQYKNLHLIQTAEYFGSCSISFLIVLFNLVLSNLFSWFFNVE
jgi:apolipoprotein N-acyltransferase